MSVFTTGSVEVARRDATIAGIAAMEWRPAVERVSPTLFVHGFMAHPRHYSRLLAHVASHGIPVVAPLAHRIGISALRGASTPDAEARILEDVARVTGAGSLAGHSRGGQVAWIMASRLAVESLVVVDPVDGTGRMPSTPTATAAPASFTASTTVIGGAAPGRCAPEGYDHTRFASMAPPGSRYVRVEMGHADILDPPARAVGRVVCGGVSNGEAAMRTVAGMLVVDRIGGSVQGAPVTVWP